MLYRCDLSKEPRHLSVGVSTFNYKLPYANIFGGITQLTKEKFEFVNGYSNQYWGWGGEDDDMFRRVIKYGHFNLTRPDPKLARFKMITHLHETGNKPNPNRFGLLKTWLERRENDGYGNLKYKVKRKIQQGIFEKVIVDIGNDPRKRG